MVHKIKYCQFWALLILKLIISPIFNNNYRSRDTIALKNKAIFFAMTYYSVFYYIIFLLLVNNLFYFLFHLYKSNY
jgi:hypothetical protein